MSQNRILQRNSTQSLEHFCRQNSTTLSACKIINFNWENLKFWKLKFLTVNFKAILHHNFMYLKRWFGEVELLPSKSCSLWHSWLEANHGNVTRCCFMVLLTFVVFSFRCWERFRTPIVIKFECSPTHADCLTWIALLNSRYLNVIY